MAQDGLMSKFILDATPRCKPSLFSMQICTEDRYVDDEELIVVYNWMLYISIQLWRLRIHIPTPRGFRGCDMTEKLRILIPPIGLLIMFR